MINYEFAELSHVEILSNALLFFLAGYETTATAMTWTLYNLALNPDVQAKLHKEIDEALAKSGVSVRWRGEVDRVGRGLILKRVATPVIPIHCSPI